MSFLNPIGLLGLLSLPLIVWLHLQHERNRRVVVSSIKLWTFLDIQLTGSKPKQIRLTWLLILDLLIALLLSLALSQPEINVPTIFYQGKHVIVLLDDSTSMMAANSMGTRFDLARKEALALLDKLGSRDVVSVLTFGGEPVLIGDTRQINKQVLAGNLSDLQVGNTGSDLVSALSLALAVGSDRHPLEIHIFTDGAFDAPSFGDLQTSLYWHFFNEGIDNQAVIAVDVVDVGVNSSQVLANIANFSEEVIIRDVVINVDGAMIDRSEVELEPRSVITQVWNLIGQPTVISIEMSGSDSLDQDDFAIIGVNPERMVKAALVSETPEPVDRAILSASNVDLKILQPEEYLPGMDFNLVVFRGTLPETWPAGTVLILDPPQGSSLLNVIGREPILNIPFVEEHELLRAVDFSGVRWGEAWIVRSWQDRFIPLLVSGEIPLFLYGKIGLSDLIVFLPVLDHGNLTRHPAFPSIVSNAVSYSRGIEFPSQISIGSKVQLPSEDEYPQVYITDPLGERKAASRIQGTLFGATKKPGIYKIETTDFSGNAEIYSFGVNAGSMIESDIDPGEWVNNIDVSSDDERQQSTRNVNLAPWLLGFVMILLVLEAFRAWR